MSILLVAAGIPAPAVSAPVSDAATSAPSTTTRVSDASLPTPDNETTPGLWTWVAPESADLSNLSALDAAKASGNLTRTEVVAENDTLVLELRASGLGGEIAARNESNVTARFSSWLDADGVSLRVRETTPGTSQVALLVNVTAPDSATVISGHRDDTYYLVVDTETVPVTDDYEPTGEQTDLRWSEYRANFTLTNESGLADDRTSAEDEFAVRPREAGVVTEYGRHRAHVASAPNRAVPVKTSLAPGSTVTVVVEGPGDSFPFEATGRVRNGSDGFVFAPTFDFSDVPPETEFTVTVFDHGESSMEYGGPRHGIVTEPTASVEWRTVSELDASVTAGLSRGGFVVVRRNSVDGEILGNSPYLEPGTGETVLVPFDANLDSNLTLVAVAFRDSDSDGRFDPETDEPYTSGNYDHRVAVSKTVAFAELDETTTRETAETSTQEGTTAETLTDPDSPADPGVLGVGSPGLGVGAALMALAALLAVSVIARRR